jgi:hypothetical protein
VFIEKMAAVNGFELEEYPFLKEVFIEGFLLEDSHINMVCPPSLESTGSVFNQIHIPGGASCNGGRDGRIDIVSELNDSSWAIFEIKKDRLDSKHLDQLACYLKHRTSLESSLKQIEPKIELGKKWMGVLVGPAIEPSLAYHLTTRKHGYSEDKDIELGAAVISRYKDAQGNVYVLADKYFPEPATNGRDYSKFSFDNGSLWHGAGQFVRHVVEHFVSTNRQLSCYMDLKEQFPDNLQGRGKGSLGVVKLASEATPSRFYMNNPRSVGPDQVVICNQWGYAHGDGDGNLRSFIEHIKKFGYQVLRKDDSGKVTTL